MKILPIITFMFLFILLPHFTTFCYGYMPLNDNNGNWKLFKIEDPFTDEIIETICKNSNDRIRDEGFIGSATVICIQDNPNDSLRAFLQFSAPFHDEELPALLRIDKNKPEKIKLNYRKTRSGMHIIELPVGKIIHAFRNYKRLAINITDQSDDNKRAQDYTYLFNSDPKIFNKIGQVMIDTWDKACGGISTKVLENPELFGFTDEKD